MKTLYVTDLDGTLLDTTSKVSDRTLQALNILYEAGVQVAAATGRSWSLLGVLRGAKLRGPYAMLGGSRIFDPQKQVMLREHTYTQQEAEFILAEMKRKGLTPFLYAQDAQDRQRIYYEESADDAALDYIRREQEKGDDRFCRVHAFAEKMQEKKFIVTARGELSLMERERDCFLAQGLYAYLYRPVRGSRICSLETAVVSKGDSVREMRALTGAERVVAFGDNGNDEDLLEAADLAIAVENATEELKQKADCVIDRHDTDAVVRKIMEMEGIRWIF